MRITWQDVIDADLGFIERYSYYLLASSPASSLVDFIEISIIGSRSSDSP